MAHPFIREERAEFSPLALRMQLELVLAHPHVVARLEAGRAQGGDDADLLEPLLEVGERLFVGEVVALEEQLDATTEDAEAAVVLALYPVTALAGRPVDAVLGLELGGGEVAARPRRRLLRQLDQDAAAEVLEALAGGRGDGQHAGGVASQSPFPLADRRLGLLG